MEATVILGFILIRFAQIVSLVILAGGLGPLQTQIANILTGITGLLTGIGVTVGVIGIIVGGLMRATAFGNERKVAISNQAIACAVIGIIIVALAQVAGPAFSAVAGGN